MYISLSGVVEGTGCFHRVLRHNVAITSFRVKSYLSDLADMSRLLTFSLMLNV